MRVFLSADMEGVTGVCHGDHLMASGHDYERARRWLTHDINAAVEGAIAGGASEVVVADGHATMRNVLIDELHDSARLVCGPAQPRNRRIVQVDGIERGKYEAAMLVGYHSRAGTPGGLLSHTWVGRLVHEIRIQGRPAGEALLNAYLFGHYGVPVVFACGADDFVREVRADLGDDLATATVKETLGPTACIALPPARSHALIRAAAEQGMRQDRSRAPLVAEPPVVIEVEFHTAAMSVQGA
ncbi:MAG: M55 family metallopeptidase, partial [Planctomycetota bacterium]